MSPLKSHYFDKSKIDKVVMNLLSNAIKFTPSGGKITMNVWDEGENLKFSIADTGIGIPKENLPHIFERFMQVDSSSTREHGGMGIGLSLVKDFVELHGGTVDVKSEVGKGTQFTVTLPRVKIPIQQMTAEKNSAALQTSPIKALQEDPWSTTTESQEQEMTNQRPDIETVLIVDDHPEMRQAVGHVLADQYNLLFANNGEEGIQRAQERKPDLIISDIMMPKIDGYGLLKELRSDPQTRNIPIILLTAKSGEESLALGFEAGADDYIPKPFSPKEVSSRVRNLIRIRKQSEEIEKQAGTIMKISSQVAHDLKTPLMSLQSVMKHWKKDLFRRL